MCTMHDFRKMCLFYVFHVLPRFSTKCCTLLKNSLPPVSILHPSDQTNNETAKPCKEEKYTCQPAAGHTPRNYAASVTCQIAVA